MANRLREIRRRRCDEADEDGIDRLGARPWVRSGRNAAGRVVLMQSGAVLAKHRAF